MMDFYELLGVSRDADVDDIKRAYRRLARRLHPDINPGDTVAALKFRAVVEAYETLSDPLRRREYDMGGAAVHVETVSYGFEGFDFSGTIVDGGRASTFGDLFGDVIQRTVEGTATPDDGADLHLAVTISFSEMMRGTRRIVRVSRRSPCRACHGAGLVAVAERVCPACRGTGAIRTVRGRMVFTKPCARCNASGRQRVVSCPACSGSGGETRAEAVTLTIPPGVHDGERLSVPGGGHVGLHGGRSGDLQVSIAVAPDTVFRRDGDDLVLTVPVGVHEAALGARFDIPTFDGPMKFRLPPATPAGQRFRLRERGVPSSRTGQRGDLVVEIRLVLPQVLDERSKALLREFGELQLEDVRGGLWPQADQTATGQGEPW